jgi:DNA-binding transcriptional ArsR family regulator
LTSGTESQRGRKSSARRQSPIPISAPRQAAAHAVVDPTRRAILARLFDNPLSVGELAEEFPVSRPAISQHLRVLKDARLVTDTAVGTRRVYAIDIDGFRNLRRFFDQFWGEALAAFKRKAEKK